MEDVKEFKNTYRKCSLYVRETGTKWSEYPNRYFGDIKGVDSDTFAPTYCPIEQTLEMEIKYFQKIGERSNRKFEFRIIIETFEEVTKKTKTQHQEYVLDTTTPKEERYDVIDAQAPSSHCSGDSH